MVVDAFDMIRPLLGLYKGDAQFIFDADRILIASIASDCFEPTCLRRTIVVEFARLMRHVEFL
jgi:hypothetical protein